MLPPLPFRTEHSESLVALDAAGWEQMLTLGRLHGLAGRWHTLLATQGMLDRVPARVCNHLVSEHLFAAERCRMARWEVDRLAHAFRFSDFPVVLLKGAAYVMAELPPGQARILSDVDILVPADRLPEVEAQLQKAGWQFQPHSPYDERYYREWMHELPPMQHVTRGSLLDVHHNILPRTSLLCPDPHALFDSAVPLPGSRLKVLAPADMVLHSVAHGFYGGEFTNCWRDVLDVHELVTHFAGAVPAFWSTFRQRVVQFGFQRPAYYALVAAGDAFGTRVPEDVLALLRAHAPPWPVRRAMRWAIGRTLLPALPPTFVERCALRALYLRSHWVKMPPALLARHLWTKFRMRSATASAAA